jgi:hypothetical protein
MRVLDVRHMVGVRQRDPAAVPAAQALVQMRVFRLRGKRIVDAAQHQHRHIRDLLGPVRELLPRTPVRAHRIGMPAPAPHRPASCHGHPCRRAGRRSAATLAERGGTGPSCTAPSGRQQEQE